jgi:glucose-1-phosphate thymidylyltransferase
MAYFANGLLGAVDGRSQAIMKQRPTHGTSAWFDMGTQDSLLEAAAFVQTLEKRQGLRIACPEEIAYEQGFITHDQFIALGKMFAKSAYGQYLLRVASERT